MNPSLYVLGAGFSKPAGLPLGNELYEAVKKCVTNRSDTDVNVLQNLVTLYRGYQFHAHGTEVNESNLNAEDFISFIDMLNLTNSDPGIGIFGNATQIEDGMKPTPDWIRYVIGLTLNKYQNDMDAKSRMLYRSFARNLQPGDVIITFNYDTILETALNSEDKEYRFFPYTQAIPDWSGFGVNVCNPNSEEIIIIKFHGSIDWFDKEKYSDCVECSPRAPECILTAHPIFSPGMFDPKPLVYVEREKKYPLHSMHRVSNLDEYYSYTDSPISNDVPFIIAPSHNKLLYINKLKEFWNIFADLPRYKQIVVIGYSLPDYDEYARLALYRLISGCLWNNGKVKFVDYRKTPCSRNEFKCNYRFVDWDRVECFFDGFDEKAISMIFGE